MPIKDVISLGVGPSTTPGITYFITFGLSMGAEAPVIPVTQAIDVARGMPQYRRGERRKRGLVWDKRRKIEDLVEETYRRLSGELIEAVNEPGTIREAIAPFAQSSDARLPPPEAIDFVALSKDLARAEALLLAYQDALERKAIMDDDDDVATVLALL